MKPELRACRTAARPCGREAVAQGGPQVWPGPGREHLGVRQGAPQVAPIKKINCLALPVRAPKAFTPLARDTSSWHPGEQALLAPFTEEEMEIGG